MIFKEVTFKNFTDEREKRYWTIAGRGEGRDILGIRTTSECFQSVDNSELSIHFSYISLAWMNLK